MYKFGKNVYTYIYIYTYFLIKLMYMLYNQTRRFDEINYGKKH